MVCLILKKSMGAIDFKEILTAFLVMFAVIDITGSIPIILDMRQKGSKIRSGQIALISFILFVVFLFLGESLLKFFNVDIPSFAVAGAVILLALAIEMSFNITIFKNDSPTEGSVIVPLVFPLIAGAGALTTSLSLRAECATVNIIIAIALNMVVVWLVLRYIVWVEKLIGKNGIYIVRKVFGVVLLAMSVKLIVSNLAHLIP